MREILFRGKSVDTKKWVYGYIVPFAENTYQKGYEIVSLDGINYDELDNYSPTYWSDEVIPETVGQFTGLTDTNGKKIFEGDIIKRTFEHIGTQYAEIGWAEKYASFQICPYKDWQYTNIKDCEKVGNIYDNPELLKEGAKR